MSRHLTSWKEIANYLGKGVRTIQRWEGSLGLPIHRPTTGGSNIVFAIPEELDEWVKALPIERSKNGAAPESALLQRVAQLESENAALREKIKILTSKSNRDDKPASLVS